MSFYKVISRFFPGNIRKNFRKLLVYAEVKVNPDAFLGFIGFLGLALGLIAGFNLGHFFGVNFWIGFLSGAAVIEIVVVVLLNLRADKRADFVEKMLPDALQLMGSNLRAGMTTDRSLLLAARPEFGPLEEELNAAGKEIALGKETSSALKSMTEHIRSEKFRKTLDLIITGLRSGGQLAPLLEQISSNLREQEYVDKKVRSNVMMYVIFIFFAIGFGAPLLFALSTFLVKTLTGIISGVEITSAVNAPLSLTAPPISVEFITLYVIVSLVTSSLLGSLIIGQVSKGKNIAGIKYAPLLAILTICLFFVIKTVVGNMLGGAFG